MEVAKKDIHNAVKLPPLNVRGEPEGHQTPLLKAAHTGGGNSMSQRLLMDSGLRRAMRYMVLILPAFLFGISTKHAHFQSDVAEAAECYE